VGLWLFVIQSELNKENKLRVNRLNDIFSILQTITEIKDSKLLLQFTRLSENLRNFRKSENYNALSLGEKVLYMEEIDKLIMKIIDLLRQIEQGKF